MCGIPLVSVLEVGKLASWRVCESRSLHFDRKTMIFIRKSEKTVHCEQFRIWLVILSKKVGHFAPW